MDNKNAIAATIGIGAIGSVLAYYGYNKLTTSSNEMANESSFVKDGEGIGTTEEQKANTIDNIKQQVTMAIKEHLTDDKKKETPPLSNTKADKWKTFWKGEYNANNTTEPSKE